MLYLVHGNTATGISSDEELQQLIGRGEEIYERKPDGEVELAWSPQNGWVGTPRKITSNSGTLVSDQLTEIQLALADIYEALIGG